MTKPISRSLELFADTRVIPCAHERHAERMLGALSIMQSPLICIELTLRIREVSMSAVLLPSLEPAQNVNLTKLRELDAFEEFFWLIEQSVPVFHTIIAEVKGETTIEQWERALGAVEVRYPLLSASIRKLPGERPFFEKLPGVSMPLRIAPLRDSLVLEEEMEKELQKPFGDGSGPLTRATLYHARDRAVVDRKSVV